MDDTCDEPKVMWHGHSCPCFHIAVLEHGRGHGQECPWGGLVGILGFPPLMDGGMLTSPNFAFWDENGSGIENVGVPPDIEVDITPADSAASRDPQLDKELEVVLRELDAKPPVVPKRPAYPNRMQ